MTYTKKKTGKGITESIVNTFSNAVFKPKTSGHNIHNFKNFGWFDNSTPIPKTKKKNYYKPFNLLKLN